MAILSVKLAYEIKTYLDKLARPVMLVASLDSSQASADYLTLLKELGSLSNKIIVHTDGENFRKPSVQIQTTDHNINIHFSCIPLGHELSSFILAILQVGGVSSPKIEKSFQEEISKINEPLKFETYVSLTCQICPEVVQALNTLAILNQNVEHTIIDGGLFNREISTRKIMAVPMVFLNGEYFAQGRISLANILARLNEHLIEKMTRQANNKPVFDVLIIGGNPAAAIVAVKAASRGYKTGIVSEQFNPLIFNKNTIAPLIHHENTANLTIVDLMRFQSDTLPYDNIDIINLQRVQELIPSTESKKRLHTVKCVSGAVLQARIVVISTGLKWKNMGIPGEKKYYLKGVAHDPLCDGPLFKGQRVAVLGGGLMGIEAAKILAKMAKQVFLLETNANLSAGEEAIQSLSSFSNISILTNAEVMEITGDGKKANGLDYINRNNNQIAHLAVECIFIQIGLAPDTSWLKGTVNLDQNGAVLVNTKGRTNIPGIYAVGNIVHIEKNKS